jgi:hypothetical protein
VHATKKVLFVDIHGVKSFPYRGRRKHFSYLKQILGNSTDCHNDLFGLAIFQFEREYKSCLERRKQNEPQILNILFPNKTDNRYLEYLENTQSQQTGKYNLWNVLYICSLVRFSFGHCIVCPSSMYTMWLSLWYLQTFLKIRLDQYSNKYQH